MKLTPIRPMRPVGARAARFLRRIEIGGAPDQSVQIHCADDERESEDGGACRKSGSRVWSTVAYRCSFVRARLARSSDRLEGFAESER